LEDEDVHIENVNSEDLSMSRFEPAASGGARNTLPFRVRGVTGGSDKITKPMVISAQSSNR
jgi:hypothetical protein